MSDTRKYVQAQKFTLAGSGVTSAATTLTLDTFDTPDGTDITSSDLGSENYITLEPGTSKEELIKFDGTNVTQNGDGTATITSVTRGLRFVAPYTANSSLQKSHAGGSVAILSNTATFYDSFLNKNNDETVAQTHTYTNPNFPRIDSDTTDPTADEQFATKGYVDRTAGAAAVSKNREVVAGNAGATLAAGNFIYLDDADSEWKKTAGATAATIDGRKLGIAQGAGIDGGAISGGVLLSGLDNNQTGLTANNVYFLADTAGTIATTAGTTERAIGIAVSTTEVVFDPYFADYITGDEHDSIIAANGTLSTSNALISQTGLQRGQEVFAADAGANDTYVITLSPVPAAYVTGMVVSFSANTANTGAATINVNSLGAKTIKKQHDLDLANNDIESGQIVTLIYDGTNFQMQSQVAVTPLTTVDTRNRIQDTGLGTASASTGSAAEQTLFTTTIAANTLGTTGGFRITYAGVFVKNTDNVTLRVKYGTTTFYNITFAASQSAISGEVYLMNNASASAQNSRGQTIAHGTATVIDIDANTTGTEDTTGALDLVITTQFTDTNTSTFALSNVVVELLQ